MGGAAPPPTPPFFILNSPLTKERFRGFNAKNTQSIAKDEKVCKWGGLRPPNPPGFFYSKLSAHESRGEMHKSVFANTRERLRGFNTKQTQSIAKDEKVCKWGGFPTPPAFFTVNSQLAKAAKRCTKACSPTHTKGKTRQQRLRGFNRKHNHAKDEKVCTGAAKP